MTSNNPPPPSSHFLQQCFFCGQRLLLKQDMYMYNDEGFYSMTCSCRQTYMDVEECVRKESNRSFSAVMMPTPTFSSPAASSFSSFSPASRPEKTSTNPPPPSSRFLQQCFLCGQRLSHKKDIYMYNDEGFCSGTCRGRQMDMDEEECSRKKTNRSSN